MEQFSEMVFFNPEALSIFPNCSGLALVGFFRAFTLSGVLIEVVNGQIESEV
jgi:hypothetical protein